MKSYPLVSIVIPVYNGSNFLREAIDSALSQTYENKEIIVVNDGSDDGGATEAIALGYGNCVRYFRKDNGGVSTALNFGINHMRGEYFSWLSHDDKYAPEKIQREVDLLENCGSERVLACCASQLIDKDSRPLKHRRFHASLDEGRVNTWKEALKRMLVGSEYNGCAFLIPKAAFDSLGGFDEDLRFIQDSLMWMKLFLKGQYGIAYSPYTGVMSRVHNAQLTQRGQELFHHEANRMSAFVIPDLLAASSAQENFLYWYAIRNAKYGNREVARKCAAAAKETALFSPGQMLRVLAASAYGRVRPLLRMAYHRLFNNIRTTR